MRGRRPSESRPIWERCGNIWAFGAGELADAQASKRITEWYRVSRSRFAEPLQATEASVICCVAICMEDDKISGWASVRECPSKQRPVGEKGLSAPFSPERVYFAEQVAGWGLSILSDGALFGTINVTYNTAFEVVLFLTNNAWSPTSTNACPGPYCVLRQWAS
jgi:hypothetical protein